MKMFAVILLCLVMLPALSAQDVMQSHPRQLKVLAEDSEVRVLRWSDGVGETLLRTGSTIPQGNIVEINTVADINDSGDVIVIAAANRSANRVLLLLPRL